MEDGHDGAELEDVALAREEDDGADAISGRLASAASSPATLSSSPRRAGGGPPRLPVAQLLRLRRGLGPQLRLRLRRAGETRAREGQRRQFASRVEDDATLRLLSPRTQIASCVLVIGWRPIPVPKTPSGTQICVWGAVLETV